MSACAQAPAPALIRVSTLLKWLANRTRSGAESEYALQLQARAEIVLQDLAEALGELDDQRLSS
jgi:hypothetical protein